MTAAALTAPGSHKGGVTAKKSDDYVSDILARREAKGSAPLSTEAKMQRLQSVVADQSNGIKRLGVGMIGPIQLKLRYQGITRNVLVEDPCTPGTPVEYDVWDDLGQAYMMSGTEGEVRITPFEGKRIQVRFFRIASRPAIRKEDLLYLRINAVEQAQDETKQAILKQEDSRLITILQAAIADYAGRADHTVTPNHVITEASGYLTPGSLYSAVSMTDMHELQSSRILINPMDYRDMYRWDINQTGWAFKDRVVAGETITSFGEFQMQRSIVIPQGQTFLTPDPQFLGVFPVLYSLDVEENHRVESFWKGWVFDEMVSMLILNPRGLAKIVKS
ncbi:HK97-fold major capsid protein [Streptomyces sp. NPDC005562]|uniref:HK97-fold major capsid protein n=1 Tax=Streptomyces sp. NPDC005562 TaxID=3154890 RepID=UPI0033A97E60